MRTLAKEILTNNRSFVEELAEDYPTYFDTNNLAITQDNYFLVASKYRLGTVQTTQFQSGDQYGSNWHWGSKCTETSGTISCDDSATPANNELAEMPREYAADSEYANSRYYNWYSSVAESGDYRTSGSVSDSLCPSGWMLPIANSGKDSNNLPYKSYYNLLFDISSSDRNYTIAEARQLPLSFLEVGSYDYTTASIVSMGRVGKYLTRTGHGLSTYAMVLLVQNSVFETLTNYSDSMKTIGNSVRCVKK